VPQRASAGHDGFECQVPDGQTLMPRGGGMVLFVLFIFFAAGIFFHIAICFFAVKECPAWKSRPTLQLQTCTVGNPPRKPRTEEKTR